MHRYSRSIPFYIICNTPHMFVVKTRRGAPYSNSFVEASLFGRGRRCAVPGWPRQGCRRSAGGPDFSYLARLDVAKPSQWRGGSTGVGSNGCEGHCSLPPKTSSYFRRPYTIVNAVRLYGLRKFILFAMANFYFGFPCLERVQINVYMRGGLVTWVKASLEAGRRGSNGEAACQLTPPTWLAATTRARAHHPDTSSSLPWCGDFDILKPFPSVFFGFLLSCYGYMME